MKKRQNVILAVVCVLCISISYGLWLKPKSQPFVPDAEFMAQLDEFKETLFLLREIWFIQKDPLGIRKFPEPNLRNFFAATLEERRVRQKNKSLSDFPTFWIRETMKLQEVGFVRQPDPFPRGLIAGWKQEPQCEEEKWYLLVTNDRPPNRPRESAPSSCQRIKYMSLDSRGP